MTVAGAVAWRTEVTDGGGVLPGPRGHMCWSATADVVAGTGIAGGPLS